MNDDMVQIQPSCPFKLVTPGWVTARGIGVEGLTVGLGVQAPHQIDTAFASHILGIVMSEHNRQEVTRINDREYDGTFASGTGFLSPAQADHFSSWQSTDRGLNIILDPYFLVRVAAENFGRFDRHRVELQCLPLIRDPQVTAIALLFQQEIETGGLGGRLYAESLRNLLSVHLLRHHCTFPVKSLHISGGLSTTQLDRVLDYVEAHLSESISLSVLAKIAGMSEFHFSRLFKQSIGISPHQYLLGQRVERAKYLLRKSPLNVTEVALECGFAHPGHLSRHFKRLVGTTPKKFQQQ